MIAGRVAWSERDARLGWHSAFTVAGSKARQGDPLGVLDAGAAGRAARILSQACFWISDDGDVPVLSQDVQRWATVARKVLQRGCRPPLSGRAEMILGARLGTAAAAPDEVLHALGWSRPDWNLSPQIRLDPTYEQPLWDWVVANGRGLARWMIPQAPLEALAGELDQRVSARWVDFQDCPPWLRAPLVIEIDGEGHRRREGADRARDAALRASGLATRRYEGAAALQPDGPLLSSLRKHAATHVPRTPDPSLIARLHAPALPARLGLALVEAVLAGFLRPGRPWRIRVVDELGLADDLAGVALDPLRAISDLWGADVVPDQVVVNDRTWVLGGGRATATAAAAFADADVTIWLEPTTPYFADLPARGAEPLIVVRGVGVPVDLEWSPSLVRDREAIPEDRPVHEPLHLLVADLFGHPGFREGQLPAIRQVLSGRDSVVLLPTGSGKSLIYQLAGLVTPGVTIVVDPLVSLIDDQAERLERDGIDRVGAMHSGRMDQPGERDRVLGALARGESLFVFATPERFQDRRFRSHLAEAAGQQLVGTLVVDEAHCVSEWGHDFRTAYLRLASTMRTRCQDRRGVAPPLLALTGTASPAVLRDVLRELEIDEEAPGALQRPSSHDRPNLRFEKVRTTDAEWVADVVDVLTDRVPEFLGVPRAELARCDGGRTLAGIVFTPHVDWTYGAIRVAEQLRDAAADRIGPMEVVVYSGRPPDGREREWARDKVESVDRFKRNAVPLLVGTKAFGMGIDKPNIRYTIHAGMPSSLEAFAQEAGRAGRNGDPALCTLVAVMPEDGVADDLLAADISASTRRERVGRTSHPAGGDLVRQAFFLANSFPGIEEEVSGALAVLADLGAPPRPLSEITIPLPRAFAGADKKMRQRINEQRSRIDRALYRLSVAGVIADLTVDGGAEATVQVADWTAATLDDALLTYLARIEPGRRDLQAIEVSDAPTDPMARIEHHVRMLIETTYRIVARARLEALRFMFSTAQGPDDPDTIRERINDYLGGGPVAMALHDAAADTRVDVRRFVEVMRGIALTEQVDLAATAARQLESYPSHPLLLLASAVGEARLPHGSIDRFRQSLEESMRQFARYGVEPDEAAEGALWLAKLLRTENQGRRAHWLVEVLRAWDLAGHPLDQLVLLEDTVLEESARSRSRPEAATFVRTRKLRRHGRTVSRLAHDLSEPDPQSGGGHP